MLLPCDANQPVVQERQISLTHRANDQRVVLGDVSSRIGKRVASPLGLGSTEVEQSYGIWRLNIRRKHADDYQQREEDEDQRRSAAEKSSAGGFLGILARSRG